MTDFQVSQTSGPCELLARRYTVGDKLLQIDKRFKVIELIGQGCYGTVLSVKDRITGKKLALKQLRRLQAHKLYAIRALREIKFGRILNHENIVKVQSIQLPQDKEVLDCLYILTELLESDLAKIIRSPNEMTPTHVKFYTYQILRALLYLHSAGVVHRDLKPSNIFIDSTNDLKIGDFGHAKQLKDDNPQNYGYLNEYIATRWYRPPEVLLGKPGDPKAIDMWAVGCILAEMVNRRPLWPGNSDNHQLQLILSHIGPPRSRENQIHPERHDDYSFEAIIPRSNDPQLLDFLQSILKFDDSSRLTAEEAMKHPYMSEFYDPGDEPISDPLSRFDFIFEENRNRPALNKELFEEISLYHFPEKVRTYNDSKKTYDAKKIRSGKRTKTYF